MRCPPDKMLRASRYALPVLCLLVACSKGDKVPSYLDIPSVQLVTTSQEQGSATSKVTDAWIYADGELLGVWELPARVPVLKEGPTDITVVPGVKRNGSYDDRLRYPYYEPWDGGVPLAKEAVTSISPTTTFFDQTTFWIEAFEDPGSLLNVTEASDTTLIRYTPTNYPELSFVDGTACAGFVLDQAHPFIRLYTNVDFTANGGPVFLEMDFRSDMILTVGALYTFNAVPQVTPYVYLTETVQSDGSMTWNKIYIDLSPIYNQGGVGQRDFYIECTIPPGRIQGEVYFDNLKLLRIGS